MVLIGAGILSLIIHLGPNYSIDFSGGTLLDLRIMHPSEIKIEVGAIRDALSEIGMEKAEIQISEGGATKAEENELGATTNMLIKVKGHEKADSDVKPLGQQIKEAIQEKYPKAKLEVLRQEEVGPKIGGELKWKMLLAIFWAMLGIVIYIWWRFEFKFGIAAIIALLHDVLITVGIFSIFNREISLSIIAALLTIVGYSLNDTIVVFDRIRENLRLLRRQTYDNIINTSINQSLSRTIITSGTTLFVIISLVILGGTVIRDFAFALFIGVLVGTYSSIFVASPLLVEWEHYKEVREKKIKRQKRSRTK